MASPESLAEIRASIPLLNAQRFQRSQLHDLINEAERVGAWLYSKDRRPYRPVATWDMPPEPDFHKARDLIREEISRWYAPAELRKALDFTNPDNYHPEDFYRFRWSLRYPTEGLKRVRFIESEINKSIADFERRINGLSK